MFSLAYRLIPVDEIILDSSDLHCELEIKITHGGNMDDGSIAYFSMEIGLNEKIPTYSGGLGVLAGDLLKSFTDIGWRVIGITLLNEKGYFKQIIDAHGHQIERPVMWEPKKLLKLFH